MSKNLVPLEAKIRKAAIFKKIIDSIKEIVGDARLNCTKTGITINAMDPANVCLVYLLLQAEGFELYRCDRNLALGLNLDTLSKVLKLSGPDDSLVITCGVDGDTIQLKFESPKGRVSIVSLKLLDIQQTDLEMGDNEYETIITLPSAELQRICTQLGVIGEQIRVSSSSTAGVTFSIEGDIANGSIYLPGGTSMSDNDEITVEIKEPISVLYSIRKIAAFTKATSLSTNAVLSISADIPLRLEYSIGPMGFLRYYLAPKIENDDSH